MNKRDAITALDALGPTAGPLHPRAQSNPSAQNNTPRAGQKVLTVHGAMPRETRFKQSLCADIDGFRCIAAPVQLS
jgi:hypothetical protein